MHATAQKRTDEDALHGLWQTLDRIVEALRAVRGDIAGEQVRADLRALERETRRRIHQQLK